MKKGLTEIVYILDRSGSMSGLEADTVGGFNSMMKAQKEETGEALVTTILFDNKIEFLHDRIPIGDIGEMTEKEYYVRGSTALLDAIGTAVTHIEKIHKYAREEDRPERTVFVINTDGFENSSREYSYDSIKKMVEKKQEENDWGFIFVGANIDSFGEAARLGIRREGVANYRADSKGTDALYFSQSKAVSAIRNAPSDIDCCYAMMDSAWADELDEYAEYSAQPGKGKSPAFKSESLFERLKKEK